MPNLKKEIAKCKHPNSRRTKALTKRAKKVTNREKSKLAHQMKTNLLGEKILWFKNNIDEALTSYTGFQFQELVEKYLSRFDDELEQITLKQSIGGSHRGRQHASRQDAIELTLKREKEEFNTCGIEMIDVRDSPQLLILKNWDGELRFLQNFKLKRIAKKHLQNKSADTKLVDPKSQSSSDLEMLCDLNDII